MQWKVCTPAVVIQLLDGLVCLIERGWDSGNQRREPPVKVTTDGEGFQHIITHQETQAAENQRREFGAIPYIPFKQCSVYSL